MKEEIDIFVPGRLCLLGEHSDWAGRFRMVNPNVEMGAAIVTGIEQGIYATAKKAKDFSVHLSNMQTIDDQVDFNCPMDTAELNTIALSGSFFAYVCGVASYVNENYYVCGVDINVFRMDMPIKQGLSSSASICVLVARAFNILYQLNLSTMGEMMVAFRGEQQTRSRCGRLDQACAFGIKPILMTFDGEDIKAKKLVNKEPLHYVFADLKGKKDTIKILSDLNKCFPYPNTEIEKNVHDALGKENLAIIDRAVEFMRIGDKAALGALMAESQQLFDKKIYPASPYELEAPLLHFLLKDPVIEPWIYGGKGVGSQGDGSIQFLSKDELCQQKLYDYLNNKGYMAYKLTIPRTFGISKVIIPVAGYGTRLYPFTKSVKKEFVPLLDTDNRLKPAILIILEQLESSGIDEIYLVIGSFEEKIIYENLFCSAEFSPSHVNYEYDKKLKKIGSMIRFIIQAEHRGMGHAIYQCREKCGAEPCLLLLGDTIYQSSEGVNCFEQMVSISDSYQQPLLAVHKIRLEQVEKYGVVKGEWLNDKHTRMRVTDCVEKPSIAFAKEHLAVQVNGEACYYAMFGQYVLTSDVFAQLGDVISNHSTCEEIDLTSSLNKIAQQGKLTAVILNATMCDLGSPDTYMSSVIQYQNNTCSLFRESEC